MHRPLGRAGFMLFTAASVLALGACAGGMRPGTNALPANALPAIADAAATPPVTAPVSIYYPYTNTWTTTTWASATAKPVSKNGSDSGTITVKFTRDSRTGVYDVPETIASESGTREVLNSAVGFEHLGGGIAQIILS